MMLQVVRVMAARLGRRVTEKCVSVHVVLVNKRCCSQEERCGVCVFVCEGEGVCMEDVGWV